MNSTSKQRLVFGIRLYLAALLLGCAGLLFYACFYFDRIGIMVPCRALNVSAVSNQTASFNLLLTNRNQTVSMTTICNGECLEYLTKPVWCWADLESSSIQIGLSEPNLKVYDENYRANIGIVFLLLLVTVPMIIWIALCGWPGSKSRLSNDREYGTL